MRIPGAQSFRPPLPQDFRGRAHGVSRYVVSRPGGTSRNDEKYCADGRFDVEAQSVSLDLAAVQSVFYGDCSEQDVALARLLLAPEPATPLSTPLQLTDDGFGRVPRIYIECARDQAIAPDLQRRMHAALPCRAVLSIDSDHSPFLSRPDELVQRLLSVAAY